MTIGPTLNVYMALQMVWSCMGTTNIYDDDDDDDNDNKPSDHEIDVSEASFFAGPQKSNLRVNS